MNNNHAQCLPASACYCAGRWFSPSCTRVQNPSFSAWRAIRGRQRCLISEAMTTLGMTETKCTMLSGFRMAPRLCAQPCCLSDCSCAPKSLAGQVAARSKAVSALAWLRCSRTPVQTYSILLPVFYSISLPITRASGTGKYSLLPYTTGVLPSLPSRCLMA